MSGPRLLCQCEGFHIVPLSLRDRAKEHDGVSREAALAPLAKNAPEAAAAIRPPSDEGLDRSAPVSQYRDAPRTCQFMLEDHVVRFNYHHLAAIRAALGRQPAVVRKGGSMRTPPPRSLRMGRIVHVRFIGSDLH